MLARCSSSNSRISGPLRSFVLMCTRDSIVVERMFDFVSLAILAGLVFYFVKTPQFISAGLIVVSLGPIVIFILYD